MKLTIEQLNYGTDYTHYNAEVAATQPYTRIIFELVDGEVNYYIGDNANILYARGDDVKPSLEIANVVNQLEHEDTLYDIKCDLLRVNGIIVVYGVVYLNGADEPFIIGSDISYSFSMFDACTISRSVIADVLDGKDGAIEAWNNKEVALWFREVDLINLCNHLRFEWHAVTEELQKSAELEQAAAAEEAMQQQAAEEQEVAESAENI